MAQEVKVITLPLPLGISRVNCYLLGSDAGYTLIDAGSSNARRVLVRELESAGCKPGSLKLVILTHGDFDHTGNAAYLRRTFGARIAMHADDAPMAERGDMFASRKKPNVVIRKLIPILSGFGQAARFTPDVLLEDGCDLSAYGLEATVISIPGHTRGSIAILTAGGDLFCGDLLDNTDKPVLNSLIDDPAAANASVAKLEALRIGTVYPGHGPPFAMDLFTKSRT